MSTPAFYVATGSSDGSDGLDGSDGTARFESTEHTNGPWGPGVQHGGPPAALLGRALEQVPAPAPRVVGRLTMDLWGPVPVGPLAVATRVERPGRSVDLVAAEVSAGGRLVARASAWRFPAEETDTGTPGVVVPAGPEAGTDQPRPGSWCGGYLDAVEWRWIHGAVMEPGPATVWMRPRLPLVHGEEMSPLQRLLVCVDSASGASAALDPGAWAFLNTELSVHLVRPVAGDWVCVDAETTLAGTSTGLAAARLLDLHGLVGRSAQALLVARR
ncbi:MAG: thioesterase family protein [Actinomycetota bacterium]|nr:thioesterase family protein [Actinomycetota bacterium]